MRAFARGFVICVGLLLGGLAGYFVLQQSWFKVNRVDLQLAEDSPSEFLFEKTRADLQKKLLSWQGQWLWKVNLKDMHASILEDSRVKAARVDRLLPQGIRITLQLQEPVFGLLDVKGRLTPVAADGTLLPPLQVDEAADFPVLRGLEFFKDEKLRTQALSLFKQLPEEGVFAQKNVSELKFSSKEGFRIFLIEPPMQVLVGEAELGLKAGRVEKVLHYLQSHEIKSRVIDARLSKKVVVRVRNEP